MSPSQPGRHIPSKSHGMRAPGPSGRPPRDAAPAGPSPSPAASPGAASTPPSADPASSPGAVGAAYVRPGSRAANRAAKRATTTGVRPKTQVRKRSSSSRSGSSTGLIVLAAIAVVIAAAVIIVGNPFGSATPSASPVAYGDGTCPTSQPASLATDATKYVNITDDYLC